jgi:hypothetical protein
MFMDATSAIVVRVNPPSARHLRRIERPAGASGGCAPGDAAGFATEEVPAGPTFFRFLGVGVAMCPSRPTPNEILRERFARGEMTAQEFEEAKKVLGSDR